MTVLELRGGIEHGGRPVHVARLGGGRRICQRLAVFTSIGRGPRLSALRDVVGCAVHAGLVHLCAGDRHFGAQRNVQVGDVGHLFVCVRVVVTVVRYLVKYPLAQLLVSFPVGHHGIVQLARGADFLVEDHVADGRQRVCDCCQTRCRAARGVVLGATAYAVFSGFHAAFDTHGKRGQRRSVLHERLGIVVHRDEPTHGPARHLLHGCLDLVHRLHVVQVAGLEPDRVSVLRVHAVVQSCVKDGAEPYGAFATRAVGSGVVGTAANVFLAADHAVVARVA